MALPAALPSGINARGQVVGWSDTAPGDILAFLWEKGTGMQDLVTLGGAFNQFAVARFALGVNARGQIVGETWSKATPSCGRRVWPSRT